MDSVIEIENGIDIAIDHTGNDGMFDPDTDSDPEKTISNAIMA
jgi:hypothetical protein